MKLIVKTLIITLCFMSSARSDSRIYQSNGDLPFVEMMLGMMTAMGMIEEIPEYLMNHGNYNNSVLSKGYVNQPGFNAPLIYQSQYPGSFNHPQKINKLAQNCTGGNCQRNKLFRLDGVWVTQYGEMLGIKGRSFLWSDGKTRYLTGEFKRRESDFSLKIKSAYVVSYQYIVDGNHMQTRDSNGIVRSFQRAPYNR